MGRSDKYIFNFYRQNIKPYGKSALLGFVDNSLFEGDLYDLSLGNWQINSDWNNFLWSTVWDDEFLRDAEFHKIAKNIQKFGYSNLKRSIFNEVPKVLELEYIKKYFTIRHRTLSLWEDLPQTYTLIHGIKYN